MSELTIADLKLSKRLTNCIRREGLRTVDHITERRERDFWKVPNFGKKSMHELKAALAKHSLTLKREF